MSHAFMTFYPGDYLRDTGHLSTEEHGAYLLLLLHAWTQGGVLPVDDELLRRITRLPPKAWAKCRAIVMAFFTLRADGYHQKRMDKELEKARAMVAKRREAVERTQQWRAANPRQKPNGHGPPDDPHVMHNERITEAQQTDNVMPSLSAPQPLPTSQAQPDSSKKESILIKPLPGTRASPERPDDGLEALLSEAGIEPPRGKCDLPERFAVHVRRVAKACEMKIPYGEVRSVEAQIAAIQTHPQVVGSDETMGLKWQPAEPVRSVEEQRAALLMGCTAEQIAKAQRYMARAS